MFKICSFLLIITCVYAYNISPIVQINTGLIEGRFAINPITEHLYFAFQGIPYAEPPTGKLRFKAPAKPKSWTDTIATKADASQCFQANGGSEDCLYLNVFTTTLPSPSGNGTLQPVMVYIHGGAFLQGSSAISQYGPEFLIEKGIVLVTLNYRLNVFGFLNTMDDNTDGNAALKDQIAALRWVQENIIKFSGDPGSITVVGHSAGSVSVEYLMQSNLTKGLFHRAIGLSGSILSQRNLQPQPQEMVKRLARALEFPDIKINAELVNKLRAVSAEELYKASVNYSIMGEYFASKVQPFAPSLEHDSPDAFITKCGYEQISNHHIHPIPYMAGYVSSEGLLFLSSIQDKRIDPMKYEKDPLLLVPRAFNSTVASTVKDRIVDYFFKNQSITNVTLLLNVRAKFMSEEFVRTVRKSIELLKTNQKVYFYKFSYETNNPVHHPNGYRGVAHADELVHLFYSDFKESVEDVQIREKMTTLFTNFVKTGNPTPVTDPKLDNIHWPSVSNSKDDETTCLTIDSTLQLTNNPDQDDFLFWEDLYKKYASTPYCTW